VLKIHNLETLYGRIPVLKKISFHVPSGEIVSLLGANGAGKTTTLKTISGIVHPSKGEIIFEGKRINGLSVEKIVKLGISMVPEGRQVFPEMSVKDNLEMGAFTRNDHKNIKEDIKKIFDYFPILKERQSQEAGTLSGGEQQMLAMSRALMSRPKLLLLDEPSLGLSPILVKQIFDIIKKLNKEGTTILLVEQNVNIALSISLFTYILEIGMIVAQGESKQLINDERVKRSYIG
jgi:branched-chain amino acid transport system ATP-binding protein